MLKILIWVVSPDDSFFQGAINILDRQHNGLELVGVTANEPIQLTQNDKLVNFVPFSEVGRLGGGMKFSSSSARNKSA